MGRSGGSSRSSSGKASFSSAKPRASAAPAPARQAAAPAPARQTASAPAAAPAASSTAMSAPSGGGGMFAGLGSSLMSGMAMGTGSALAHRAVDGIMGPRQIEVSHSNGAPAAAAAGAAAGGRCSNEQAEFDKCMTENRNSSTACRYFYDAMSSCQESN